MPERASSRTLAKTIVLITIDILRADHVSCYGYRRLTTPFLDRLAGEGVQFLQAFAPAPYTAPSQASLLTAKYPSCHSIGFHNGDKPLDRTSEITLLLILKDIGFHAVSG